MESLQLVVVLLLIPSVIPAQRYYRPGPVNPNDEPFLPIYPTYPYSPKLMKRGTDRELSAELYAPKVDARDSYASSYGVNYPRDVYAVNGPKNAGGTTATGSYPYAGSGYAGFMPGYSTPYPGGYSSPYPYGNPYGGPQNGFTSGPAGFTSGPNSYISGPNPYIPGAPAFTPGPNNPYTSGPSPFVSGPNPYGSGSSYPPYPFYPFYPYAGGPGALPGGPSQDFDENAEDEPEVNNKSPKKSEKKNRYGGGADDDMSKESRYLEGNYLGSRDLDGQSSSYKTSNQLEGSTETGTTSGLPRTSYRVVSLGGHPVDYPLPQSYAKVQHLEQLMSQTIAKILAQQTSRHQAGSYDDKNPGVIAKTGLAYVVSPANLSKNVARHGNYRGTGSTPVIIKVQEPLGHSGGGTLLSKINKFTESGSRDKNSGIYVPPEAKDIVKDTGSYDYDASSQSYETSGGDAYKNKNNEQNYGVEQNGAYSSHVTSQPSSFSYSDYARNSSSRDFKPSSDDAGFGNRSGKA